MNQAGLKDDVKKDKEVEIEPSMNAGLYLCEYIYSRSLIEAKKREIEKPKVLFMHCCADGVPYTVHTGVEVLKKVVEGAIRDGEKARS